MSIVTWKPEVWSAQLRRFLLPELVMAQPRCMNRNWEGEIKGPGDTVHIRKFGDGAAIRDYVSGTPMDPPDRPGEGKDLTLTVDQQKAFYIAVDDVDAVQADIDLMAQYMKRTARNLAVTLDQFAASKFLDGAIAANTLGSQAAPITVKADKTGDYTPYQLCVEARRLLRKQNLPLTDLWMVINADLEAEFLNEDIFQSVAVAGAENFGAASALRQGQIGTLAGFNIISTEAVATAPAITTPTAEAACPAVIFGDGNYSLTWADQIVKTEAERLQGQFSDAVKGLNVFGASIVEPTSYGVAYLDPTAFSVGNYDETADEKAIGKTITNMSPTEA